MRKRKRQWILKLFNSNDEELTRYVTDDVAELGKFFSKELRSRFDYDINALTFLWDPLFERTSIIVGEDTYIGYVVILPL